MGCWVSATEGDCSCCSTASAEEGDVIGKCNEHDKSNRHYTFNCNCAFKPKKKKKRFRFLYNKSIKMYSIKKKTRKKVFLSVHLINEAHTFYLKLLAQSHLSHLPEKMEMEGWKGR